MKITIPIEPVGQMRARHGRIKTKSGQVISKTFKADVQADREETLKTYLARYQPAQPFSGPLMLGVRAYLSIPRSKSKKWQAQAAAGEIRPTKKPDLDNILKHVKDCLSQMIYWTDDAMVVEYLPGTGKWYSDHPRWEIEIIPLEARN